jgi:hypothetical protein
MLWAVSYNSGLTGSLSSVVVNNGVDVSVYFNLFEVRSDCLDCLSHQASTYTGGHGKVRRFEGVPATSEIK